MGVEGHMVRSSVKNILTAMSWSERATLTLDRGEGGLPECHGAQAGRGNGHLRVRATARGRA